MDNIEKFKHIVSEMTDTYIKKNADYGNSFETTLDKWGVNIGLARIEDKFNRITTLLSSLDQKVNDESIEDTLKDMATYTIMLLMWLKKEDRSVRDKELEEVKDYYKYLENIKNYKLQGGINSNGFPSKTMYADVDKIELVLGTHNIRIYFKNVRNTRNQIVGSGTYIGEYPIDKLSDYGLEKEQIS